jgi:hypothetical protein
MEKRMMIGALALGAVLAAGPAWALSDADTGGEWLQAPAAQKIQVANILSRELGGDPYAIRSCLDQMFTPGSPNLTMLIRDAAQQCRDKK